MQISLCDKSFVKITLTCSISEINTSLHFMQKFKMATKSGRKPISAKSRSRMSRYPVGQKFHQNRFSSFCVRDKHILCKNTRWPPKVVGKRFLREDTNRICSYPEGKKFCQKISGLLRFQDKHILRRNSRWPPKVVGRGFWQKDFSRLQKHCGSKISSKSL